MLRRKKTGGQGKGWVRKSERGELVEVDRVEDWEEIFRLLWRPLSAAFENRVGQRRQVRDKSARCLRGA